MTKSKVGLEQRVLVLAPTGKDAELILTALRREGLRSEACADVAALTAAVRDGVGVIVLAEEAIAQPLERQAVQRVIDAQASWSDLPVLLLSKVGDFTSVATEAVSSLGNVTVLQRPTQIATLSSAVITGLRTRERQYRLRAADERKDAFLATLAHELRNPLAPLSNALHILRRQGIEAPQREWAIDIIQRQSVQMTRLVDDLLDVARISQGKVNLQRERVDARELVRNAVEVCAPGVATMNHLLTVDVPNEPLMIDADAVRITQCISNLLNNAVKYTPAGGRITLSAHADGGRFELTVKDNGIGIPAQALPEVFALFSQVDRALPHAQGGLGIGLSIVKAFVEMHGGAIVAQSAGEGQGSRFTMSLPVAEGAALPQANPDAGALPAIAALRILVVDDNVDSADSLGELLAASGHDVQRAYSGRDALRVAAAHRPHVAILDIGLPDMDGVELGAQLRRGDAPPRLLIALSGWGQAADRARSTAAGFDHHLVKPADPDVIDALIRDISDTPLPA